MPEEIEQAYRKARRASYFGSLCMYVLATISLLSYLFFLFAITSIETFDLIPSGNQIASLITTLLTTTAIVLLGEFLRHFWRDCSPFGQTQSIRLFASGLLLGTRMVIDLLFPEPLYELSVVNDAIAITTQPGPDLKVVVMVVFLICLAMVIRYGNALKEDSDSIA